MASERRLFVAVFDQPVQTETLTCITNAAEIHRLNDHTVLIESSVAKAGTLSELLGMTDDSEGQEPLKGVVFKLNGSYGGYWPQSLWDWLERVRDKVIA